MAVPVLSEPVHFRNFVWQIKIFPFTRPGKSIKSLAFYVLCKDPSGSESWSCNASLDLKVKSYHQDRSDGVRKISHLFCQQEAECGFTYYTSWNKICLNDRIVKAGAVTFKAVVEVFESGGGWTSRIPEDDLLKSREKDLKLVPKTYDRPSPKWTEYQEWTAEMVSKMDVGVKKGR